MRAQTSPRRNDFTSHTNKLLLFLGGLLAGFAIFTFLETHRLVHQQFMREDETLELKKTRKEDDKSGSIEKQVREILASMLTNEAEVAMRENLLKMQVERRVNLAVQSALNTLTVHIMITSLLPLFFGLM